MNKPIKSSATSKSLVKISKALFVLSQFANKRKLEIADIHSRLESIPETDTQYEELQHKLKMLVKKQQFFHAERTQIIRHLIQTNSVSVKGYVTVDDYNYGVVQIADYQFYTILNKKIVNRLNLEQIGTELESFDVKDVEELERILPLKEAKKVFNLYLAKIRLNKAKPKQLKKEKAASKDVVLSKSVGSTGNIMVIKKRKFSNLAASNKPSV
ncbi:hypothetical protein V6380_17180 [Acinetobacter variabilis]|uniref:hypothetical protein n=1 Tax=Acinetobacter variabilis TaxID=70346 RepID=UPI003B83E00B